MVNQPQHVPKQARSSEDTKNWDDDSAKENSTMAVPTPHLSDLKVNAPHWTLTVDGNTENNRVA